LNFAKQIVINKIDDLSRSNNYDSVALAPYCKDHHGVSIWFTNPGQITNYSSLKSEVKKLNYYDDPFFSQKNYCLSKKIVKSGYKRGVITVSLVI